MKKYTLALFALALFSTAFAGSGKAIIAHANANDTTGSTTVYYISNITGHDLEVTVTFYDQNGNVTTSGVSYSNFITGNTEIAAGKTGIVTFAPTTWLYGYAVIEWNNTGTDDDVLGLISQGFSQKRDVTTGQIYARFGVPINSGEAF